MGKYTILAVKIYHVCILVTAVHAEELRNKLLADWSCDETECYYTDTILEEEKCETTKSIPYRYNNVTGNCELNLIGLLLSFRVLNDRLGKIVEEKNRKRSDEIFQGIIYSGNLFLGFASVCAFAGCFYCCWMQYSAYKWRKSVKKAARKVLALQALRKTQSTVRKEEQQEIRRPDKSKIFTEEVHV